VSCNKLAGVAAFILLAIAGPSFAQQWSWTLNRDLLNPSGINPPRGNSPFLFDIDLDGDLDLILGRYDSTIALYYNDGFPENQRLRLDEDYFAALSFDHAVKPSLGDFDGDDSLELVVGFSSPFGQPHDSLRVFRNRGTIQNPTWDEIYGFFNVSTYGCAYYKFIDWDSDGDYDLILSEYYSDEATPYRFFRNLGMPANPFWEPDSSISNALPTEYSPCGNEGFDVCDLNADGALDFIFGTVICGVGSAVNWILNEGTNENPLFYDDFVWMDSYSGWGVNVAAGDIDSDGDLDIFSAGYYPLVIFQRNDGNNHTPVFDDQGMVRLGPFYIDNLLDLLFFDRDNDGDLDFGASIFSYNNDPGGFSSYLQGFENQGNPAYPDYHSVNWIHPGAFDSTLMVLTAGDINGDGWRDIVFSVINSPVCYLNGPDLPFARDPSVFEDIVLPTLKPCLIDLDLDGDLDLLGIGAPSNDLTAYENTGTVHVPHWEQRYEWTGELDRTANYAKTANLDGDNRADLILKVGGQFKGYLNIGSEGVPAFEYVPAIFENYQWPAPYIGYSPADLDGDGDDDLIINNGGEILFVENESTLDIENVGVKPYDSILLSNYPNPFNASTTIKFNLSEPGKVELRVFDITGSLVKILTERRVDAGRHSVIWDGLNDRGNKVGSGIYLYSLKIDNSVEYKKMILLK